MAVTITQLQTHVEAARSASASGDYATAEAQALAGLMVLGGLTEGAAAGASFNLGNARQALESALETAKRLKRAALISSTGGSGIQRTRIKYKRATT